MTYKKSNSDFLNTLHVNLSRDVGGGKMSTFFSKSSLNVTVRGNSSNFLNL